MSEELTAKEALETIQNICTSAKSCDTCELGRSDFCYRDTGTIGVHADEIIEICKQRKINHANIETEWIHVCRIIEDKGNSKHCVYEEEIDEYEILPFDTYDKIAEEVLEEYAKNHEGNFFATVERLCRRVVK